MTPRLRATPVSPGDAPFFRRLWADERVARTLGGVRDAAAADKAVHVAIDHWRVHGFGRWVLWAGDLAIGTVKLAECQFTGTSEVEIGYAILPEFWGCGYASEAARGALDYARDRTDLRQIVAIALRSNGRSIAVLERLEFRYAGDLDLPEGTHAVYRRRIRRP